VYYMQSEKGAKYMFDTEEEKELLVDIIMDLLILVDREEIL